MTETALRTDVSVLYVDPRGPYPSLVADWWDAERDATGYAGPNPVVAHPPCGPWGRLRHLSTHPEERPLALLAVGQVRRWGGVLEHPAESTLWKVCDLPGPGCLPDEFGGVTISVRQVDWGHVAPKPTWLYCVRVSSRALRWPPPGKPTHYVSGTRKRNRTGRGGVVPLGIKVCSAQQRRRTPVEFAKYLIDLASTSYPRAREAI